MKKETEDLKQLEAQEAFQKDTQSLQAEIQENCEKVEVEEKAVSEASTDVSEKLGKAIKANMQKGGKKKKKGKRVMV